MEELVSEIRLLRALATNGLITTSMVHDLKSLEGLLVSRVDGFKQALERKNIELVNRNLKDLRTMIIAAEMLRRSRLRCCGVPRCAATR